MAKFIQLINLDEIKALRITCECSAYWSGPIELIGDDLLVKCTSCMAEIPRKDIKELSQKINHIQKSFKDWKGSIELEIEVEKPSK